MTRAVCFSVNSLDDSSSEERSETSVPVAKMPTLPVLMRPEEVISLKEAVYRTGRNEKTIRRWCKEDGIGRRSEPGAAWEISVVALEAKRYGDLRAISDLQNGYRSSPSVLRYLHALGFEN